MPGGEVREMGEREREKERDRSVVGQFVIAGV